MPLPGDIPPDLDIPALLMSLAKQALPSAAAESAEPQPAGQCRSCGLTAADFRKHGRLGCPECYRDLALALAPMLAAMHRGAAHVGKRPAGEPVAEPSPVPAAPASPAEPPPTLARLKAALAVAVNQEEYETAARLRDEIRKRGDAKE